MNYVTVNICGIVLAVLVVYSSQDLCLGIPGAVKLSAPFHFSYITGNTLNAVIKLKNTSPDIHYAIHEEIINEGDTTTDTIAQFEGSSEGEYNKKICHEIKKQKNNKMPLISIYLSLQTNKRRCENITILEWKTRSMYSEVVPGYTSRKDCLGWFPCTIEVDLQNKCIDSSTKRPETESTITASIIMEDDRRRTTSVRQLELLVTFMEGHTNFAVGQVRSKEGRAVSARLWEQCADITNSEGVTRTARDWSKFWNDYKCRVRAKVTERNRSYRATGGGPSRVPQLTPLEERVAAILGRDVGPLIGVRQDPEIQIEYLNTEEMAVEQEVILPAINSPILDLSLIQESYGEVSNRSPVRQDLSRTVTLESPSIPPESQRDVETIDGNNQPAHQGNTPPPTVRSRSRQPRHTRPRASARPRYVHQSNTAALDEARATVARIEEMRSQTDATMARVEEMRVRSDATMATAMTSIAESLRSYLSRN